MFAQVREQYKPAPRASTLGRTGRSVPQIRQATATLVRSPGRSLPLAAAAVQAREQ